MPPWTLVTPSSRGIGLALARHLLRRTRLPVIATARSNPDATREAILSAQPDPPPDDKLDCVRPNIWVHGEAPRESEQRLSVLKLDVTNENSIAGAAEECKSKFPAKEGHLHLACCIPGILYPEKSPQQLELSKMREQFDTNIVGPMLVLKHFSRFLPRKSTSTCPLSKEDTDSSLAQSVGLIPLPGQATWLTMSARVGSINDNNLGGWYSYRASKAAVNQLTKTFDNHLKTMAAEKAIAVAYHPGTVKTGLSRDFWGNVKKDKLFSAEFAAEKLLQFVGYSGENHRGKCWDWKGEPVPA